MKIYFFLYNIVFLQNDFLNRKKEIQTKNKSKTIDLLHTSIKGNKKLFIIYLFIFLVSNKKEKYCFEIYTLKKKILCFAET